MPLTAIGPYRLIRVIGEGGMGSVFLAEQDAPVRRSVAIKVIRTPFARAEDRTRFQAEQQAMARLQHPNVAQIFEAGTTPEGYPYFVMELLDGEEMVEYCDRRAYSIEQRLELFLSVCDGVQHAHQKSIVHRDLKPSNILVVEIDGRPVPKIIDFGIAKSLDHPLVDAAAPTADGIMGTLAYLSPEAVTRADLDSASTSTPSASCSTNCWWAISRTSRTVCCSTTCCASRSSRRRRPRLSSLRNLPRCVRSWRSSAVSYRQCSSGGCAATSPRSCSRASPRIASSATRPRPSCNRTSAVFSRTNRWRLASLGRSRACASSRCAIAESSPRRSSSCSRSSTSRSCIVTSVPLVLCGMPSSKRSTRKVVARAKVLRSIGRALMHQGDDERAQKLLIEALAIQRKELGPDHPNLAETLVELGVLRQRYDLAEGERYLREAVRIRELRFGPDDLWLANSLADLADIRRQQRQYDDAERLLLRSIAIREKKLRPDDPLLAASFSGLGRVYRDARRFDEAERYLFRALALRTKAYGPDHYVTSRSYDSIAELRSVQERWPEAEEYLRKDLAIVERVRGADHKYTAWVRVDLAETLVHQGREAEARALLVRALPRLERAADLQHVYAQGVRMLRAIE